MTGTRAGSKKRIEKMKETYGEYYKDYFVAIGRKGGQSGKGPDYKGGFASSKELAARAGSLGGKRSKRGYKYVDGEYVKCQTNG